MKKTTLNEQVSRIKQMMGIVEQIDSDDEELELAQLYNDEDEEAPLDGFTSEFSDPDEFSDLHDLSIEKRKLSKYKPVDMGGSPTRDMGYKGAMHHNEIPGAQRDDLPWDYRFAKKEPTSDYYLRTYGTPDPDMESETLADRKKNAPLDFPKYTKKDRNDPENLLSWDEKKKLMAKREEKRIAMELKKIEREELRNKQLNAWNEKNGNITYEK
jgi:hypothetical protein